MAHPYLDQPPRAFWKSALTTGGTGPPDALYQPRFNITRTTRIATAGSCFAQHIGRYLRLAGCEVLDAEPPPRGMSDAVAARFGYGLFSGRYGNIYTARQMLQLLQDVASPAPLVTHVWPLPNGKYVDGLRPTVEPEGLTTRRDVLFHRGTHLARLAKLLTGTDIFVFTLGLTEAWIDSEGDRALPVCPGVVAGTFDPERHRLANFTHAEVLQDLHGILTLLHRFNPAMRLLLTVSPVPLVATATDAHVVTATAYSKSVLRAATGAFVQEVAEADYFPSFEIVTAPVCGGPYFEADQRGVSQAGVDVVMKTFLEAHGIVDRELADRQDEPALLIEDDLQCDDLLLDAFAK